MPAAAKLGRRPVDGRMQLTPKDYRRDAAATFGSAKRVPKRTTAAAKLAKQQLAPLGGGTGLHAPESTTHQVGNAPEGFGKYIGWSEKDQQLALVVFLNAGDSSGVAIQGVRATDRMEIVSAVGNASFSDETKN